MSSTLRRWAIAGTAMLLVAAVGVVGLFALDWALSFAYERPPTPADWHEHRKEKSGGVASGLDWRSHAEFMLACRAKGCRPYISASQYASSGPLIPITGGMPNSLLVGCNELGFYRYIRSDKYGFNNNADDLFDEADYVLVGDSFGQGGCIDESDTIAGLFRQQGVRILNLGVGGIQPIDELGTIKEFMPRARTLVWMFFEGNDYAPTMNDSFMARYLQPDFSQSLKLRQVEVVAIIADLERRAWEVVEQAPAATVPQPKSWRTRLQGLFPSINALLLAFSGAGLPFDSDYFQKTLAEGRRVALERGVERMIVVYLPTWERFAWRPRSHPQVGKFDVLRDSVARAASASGFGFVDVTERFYREPDPKELFPFSAHGHFTPKGSRIAAETIAESLGLKFGPPVR